MQLFYDANDLQYAAKLKDERFRWLQELGAVELSGASPDDAGYLFGYHFGTEAHRLQVGELANVRDRPEERKALVRLDEVLTCLLEAKVEVPMPRTWILRIDEPLPDDLEFPLFVRTPLSSWKRGGDQAKVHTLKELTDEADLLRHAFGWDVAILAREWLDIAVAGQWMYGNAPQEVRTWIVDGEPIVWSFHYLHAVPQPTGFPPAEDDLHQIRRYAAAVAKPFSSRLIAVDFVRDTTGAWHFLETAPGAMAGTAHEAVFKFVAKRLRGEDVILKSDATGGVFPD